MVNVGDQITAADINAIIAKINGEENTRAGGETDLVDVVVGELIYGQTFKDMIARNLNISADHVYAPASGHSGCPSYTYTPTATTGNHDVGDVIYAAGINEIEADIDTLIAECDCDTYACACDTRCTCDTRCSCNPRCNQYCGCDGQKPVCGCYPTHCYCWGQCPCNAQCTCNNVCTCDNICNCEYT